MRYGILDSINSPDDLKKLPEENIDELCREIRAFLIENVQKNGGHLASNLGVTELSVALHRTFDSPRDHIIFDVGHQAYVHKMLTGRKNAFSMLRKTGGLSGFTKISESEHDAFGAGHSSTSVSAALGFAEAERLNKSGVFTVAVLGDGAYTGGMVHEALNNCDPDLRLIIVLNENGMSISLNKGTFASYLSKVRISKGYRSWKKSTTSVLGKIPFLGKTIRGVLTYIRNKFKNLLYSSNYFEDLGLYYMGPIDGNDYKKVSKALEKAKSLEKCVVVHVKTVKGKGFEPAEISPDVFHGIANNSDSNTSFHSVFAEHLNSLAEKDSCVAAITAAMGIGTGLDAFEQKHPDRYFDVGIAEGHALTFSAGLSAAGYKPFVAIYSTFLQRGYDSIVHDIALQNLPVKMMIDRAGLAHADGPTHHGIFDVSFLSHIPGVEIFSPATYDALHRAMDYAYNATVPTAIRYPNCGELSEILSEFYGEASSHTEWARFNFSISDSPKKIFITYGLIAAKTIKAAKDAAEEISEPIGLVLLERLKPYDDIAKEILPYVKDAETIVFAEEGIKNGGAAMLLKEALLRIGFDFSRCDYRISAIDDNFAAPEDECDIFRYVGLSADALKENILYKN